MIYHVRFNKTRGQAGRGTLEHVWRVFEDGKKEYILKNIEINVPCKGGKTGEDWSMICEGKLSLNRETSTGIIDPLCCKKK
jgi:hypothetical protein